MKEVKRGKKACLVSMADKVHESLIFRKVVKDASDEEDNRSRRDKSKTRGNKDSRDNKEWAYYCAEYNRGKCNENGSHEGWYNGNQVTKLHVCKRCLTEKRKQVNHPETASCPIKI